MSWTLRNPVPTGNGLFAVANGASRVVAVGENGAVISSLDGVVWVSESSATTNSLSGISFGNARFVAVSGERISAPVTSLDGREWAVEASAPQLLWSGISYGNGRFVGTANSGHVAVSVDGLKWDVLDLGTGAIDGISFVNSQFMAFSATSGSTSALVSNDGLSWKVYPMPVLANIRAAAYKDGSYVAVGFGYILKSNDGQNWSEVSHMSSIALYSVIATETGFLAIGSDFAMGSGVAFVSSDGVQWSKQVLGGRNRLYAASRSPRGIVAVGASGAILSHVDGSAWIERSVPAREPLRGIAAGNGAAVAVGDKGTVLRSTDLLRWSEQISGSLEDLRDVAFGKQHWVAVGRSGTILESDNTERWSLAHSEPLAEFFSVTFAKELFVAVGGQGSIGQVSPIVWTSPDGLQWMNRSPFLPLGTALGPLRDVIYTPEKAAFVSVGDAGVIVSPDGVTWSRLMPTPGLGISARGVAFGAGVFVAVGPDGIQTSTNAQEWVSATGYFNTELNDVVYVNGAFWAVGNTSTRGEILRSTDGAIWSVVEGINTPTLWGAGTLNGVPFAVGHAGTIHEQLPGPFPPFLRPWDLRAVGGGAQAGTVDSPAGSVVSIQASSDLNRWAEVQRLTNTLGRAEFIDSAAPNSANRFYRGQMK